MPRKKKTLPKDFEATLRSGDLVELQAIFDGCELDARGGLMKQVALAYADCPDELARWLVENGADLAAEDQYGDTPLHARSGHIRGRIATLLALGADVRQGELQTRGTPLHRAASACIPENARLLLAAGAPVDAYDRSGLTPLEVALQRCTNSKMERMADLADVLLAVGAQRTTRTLEWVARIGTNFEFHRSRFDPDSVDATSAALDRLYALFEVPPVSPRVMHDGSSPIVPAGRTWEESYRLLWDSLVPSLGAAATVQGEVVRIAGRIVHEIDGNGGVNWDAQFRSMADAWLEHVGTGTPLPPDLLIDAAHVVRDAKSRRGEVAPMRELAVAWVPLNPRPIPLPVPTYDR